MKRYVVNTARHAGKSQLANYMKLWQDIYTAAEPALTFSEGKVYGEPYLIVSPTGLNWWEMRSWCVESFGPTPEDGVWTPKMRWYENNSAFWFRNQKDRDWFVMRWSCES